MNTLFKTEKLFEKDFRKKLKAKGHYVFEKFESNTVHLPDIIGSISIKGVCGIFSYPFAFELKNHTSVRKTELAKGQLNFMWELYENGWLTNFVIPSTVDDTLKSLSLIPISNYNPSLLISLKEKWYGKKD